MIPGVVAGAAAAAGAGGDYATLLASLGPVTYLRCNDNAANSTVVDVSAAPANGALLSVVNGVATSAKNTDTVSAAGLLAGSSDKAFAIAGSAVVTSPAKTLTSATGWAGTCIVRPDAAPGAGNSNVSVIMQLVGDGAGCPELRLVHVTATTFRLAMYSSGVGQIASTGAVTWPYGSKLVIVLNKLPAGKLELWVNGVKIVESTGEPTLNYYAKPSWWGAARFGAALTAFYQVIGSVDECALFKDGPLTSTEIEDLAAAA
ncbi:hypothetical protein [Marilutibacter spongiae]|uniref:LamG domain-containing protein n=1 Tax=Marilutibacter spongiae TaxID=2025720 RepID=A0A7W3Y6U7_9GAMM|nr:hypothetical protein [Lysobacter spongiae]MBB1061873.1 hypothetical protein [Lysobacter spongiae]